MWRVDDPPIMMTGNPLTVASSSAGNPLRNPGADTVSATAGLALRKPSAAAALTASASCRIPI